MPIELIRIPSFIILTKNIAETVFLNLRVNMIFVFTFDNLEGPLFTFEVGIIFYNCGLRKFYN